MSKKRWTVFVIAVTLGIALSMGMQPHREGLVDFADFLAYLVQPTGIAAAAGFVLSLLAEYLPPYQDLADKWKQIVFFGICEAVPLAATGLGIWLLGWEASIDLFWKAVQAGYIAFGTGTVIHNFLPKRLKFERIFNRPKKCSC